MILIKRSVLLIILALTQVFDLSAQVDSTAAIIKDTLVRKDTVARRHHIAVFTPLYLDSAFDATGAYRFNKDFPKFMTAGIEFWEGAQLAIDSLQKEGLELDVHIYDTRSTRRKFETLLTENEIKQMDLIIGHVTVNEAAALARIAAAGNIPFINTNLPNDAGVTNNPNYVVLNSTLQTHITGMYKFLQRNFALSNIIVFRRKGATEDMLRNFIINAEKSTSSVPLKLKYVTLENNFTYDDLTPFLDSNITNVVLAGSLDATFAQNLCQRLSALSPSYTTSIMGMPTWEGIDFEKSLYKGIEIYYSTPFYVVPTNKLAVTVQDDYKNDFFVRPSEIVFRGFETIYHFTHLLKQYDKSMGTGINDKKFILFSEFDIQPVLNKQSNTPDYFENKKLYFVKKVDGIVKAVY